MNAHPLVVVLGICTAVMLCGWLVQQRRRNPALADLLWAACISASALYCGLVADGAMLPRLLVAMMGGIGGFRLFMYLLQRMLAEPADSRYRALRERARENMLWMLGFFVSRGLSATLFSVPLFIAASNPRDQATIWTMLAAGVYLVGLSGEAYADIQLAKFRNQPRNRGRTCRRGLWRYSRHPNYFFAFVHWCSYALLAVGMPRPLWSLTLIAPALTAGMAWRRMRAIEAEALRTRGEEYRVYQETTSALIPWLPKGWPRDAAIAAAWYSPPDARAASMPRATPLPGARITPSPASRLPAKPSGPTTPQPAIPLTERGRSATADAVPRLAADVEE